MGPVRMKKATEIIATLRLFSLHAVRFPQNHQDDQCHCRARFARSPNTVVQPRTEVTNFDFHR